MAAQVPRGRGLRPRRGGGGRRRRRETVPRHTLPLLVDKAEAAGDDVGDKGFESGEGPRVVQMRRGRRLRGEVGGSGTKTGRGTFGEADSPLYTPRVLSEQGSG